MDVLALILAAGGLAVAVWSALVLRRSASAEWHVRVPTPDDSV
ncbi:hypothetical protein [Micromonospora sp. RTP1Z1]|nr:hypothetical protein [Micromonospora sp. RTP1Z1]